MTGQTGATGLPGVDPGLAERMSRDVARVEEFIQAQLAGEEEFIASAANHLFAAGGKRFRPMLTVLCSYLGGAYPASDEVVAAAAGVELTHLASLYHDDVMDEATTRRGALSANLAFGNTTAILVGDLLFGKASAIVADLGAEAVRIQAQTFVRLCAGQIRDARPCPPGEDRLEYYLGVLRDKTGSLIATAAQYGGMFGGAAPGTVEVLRRYGESLGMAFQLADDILDVTGDVSESGKAAGTDLREGVDTLPVILVRAQADPSDARLIELLDADLTDDRLHAEALSLLRQNPMLARAQEMTRQVADEACEVLAPLGESAGTDALKALARSAVVRVR